LIIPAAKEVKRRRKGGGFETGRKNGGSGSVVAEFAFACREKERGGKKGSDWVKVGS